MSPPGRVKRTNSGKKARGREGDRRTLRRLGITVVAGSLGVCGLILSHSPEEPAVTSPDQASSSPRAERVIGMLGKCVTDQYDIHRWGQPAVAREIGDGVIADIPADTGKHPFYVIEVGGKVFAHDPDSQSILNKLHCNVELAPLASTDLPLP